MNKLNSIGGSRMFREMNPTFYYGVTFIFWNIILSFFIYSISTNFYQSEIDLIDGFFKSADNISFLGKYIYIFEKFILSDGLMFVFISVILNIISIFLKKIIPIPSFDTFPLKIIFITGYIIFYIFDIYRYPDWPFNFPPGWKKEPTPITPEILNKIKGFFNIR